MIKYVVMDYDGELVTIDDGRMYYREADEGQHWDSETLQFEDDEDDNCDDVAATATASSTAWAGMTATEEDER